MNTHQLEIFYHVAKHLSISKAAQQLYISQPAVSLQVKKLEQAYQVKLIEREGRGSRLTSTGQELYHLIHPFFNRTLPDVEALLRQATSIKIYGNYLMTQFIVPEMLGQQAIPQANNKILIKSMSSFSALAKLKQEACDLILISSTHDLPHYPEFEVINLFDDELVLMSKSAHRQQITGLIVSQSKKDSLSLMRGASHHLVDLPTTIVDATQDALAAMKINPTSATLVSARFIHYIDKGVTPFATGIKSHFFALYRKDSPRRALIQNIIQALSEN